MFIQYRGEFKDVYEDAYKIDIIDTERILVGVAPEEIIIQSANLKRKEMKKTDAVHSASLSLILVAMRDMQFFELYTSNQYKYIVKVYRNDMLVWSGHIDSEVYEEPYNYSERYPVTIVASDFGVMKRNKILKQGAISIFEIIKSAIENSRIEFKSLYIADTITSDNVTNRCLENLFVNVSNFEDKNIYEIVEGVLKAFSLQLLYVDGNVYISDLNTLYKDNYFYNEYNNRFLYVKKVTLNHDLKGVKLLNADATISVQPIYQNATITYRVNPEPNLLKLSGGTDFDKFIGEESIEVPGAGIVGFKLLTYHISKSSNIDVDKGMKWVKMIPYNSDAKISGLRANRYTSTIDGVIITNKNLRFITPSEKYRMRIKMSVLLSVSNNPFENSSLKNEEGNNNKLQNHSNIIRFKGDIFLKNNKGKVLYYYSSTAGWLKVVGDAPREYYVFSYYNENRRNQSPAGGMMTNGCFISTNNRDPLSSLAQNNISKGDIISMPPVTGYLEINVYGGFECFDYKSAINQNYDHFRWLIYEGITIDVEDVATGKPLSNDDIVYKCRINDYAKDEYKETLLIGSNIDENPLSKSNIYNIINGDYRIVTEFKKGQEKKQLEDWRIISLFSNFANKLIQIDSTIKPKYGYGYVVEKGKKLLISSSDHNLAEGTVKVKMIEFCEDNYNVYYE